MKNRENNKINIAICICAVLLSSAVLLTSCSGGSGEATTEPDTVATQTTQSTDMTTTVQPATQAPDTTLPEQTQAPTEAPAEQTQPVFNPEAPKPVYSQQQLEEMYPDAVLKQGTPAGQDYIDSIVFIGDSTTHGLAYYEVLKGGKETTQVWTPKNGTLAMWNVLTEKIVYPGDGVEYPIKDAAALIKPSVMVITLGVNGVSTLGEKEFKGFYSDLVDAIQQASPSTKIILQSIYPVAADYEYVKSISMEKINTANTWIAALASEKGVHYLNTISVLIDESGYIPVKYTNGDGIHLSTEGFGVILDYIKQHPLS
ncbi:MAG: GDSL-type esterase/lipase family protein [Eubacteriales bacterium]